MKRTLKSERSGKARQAVVRKAVRMPDTNNLKEGERMEFKTIRQVAALGILPEHRLRVMQKAGTLPGIWSGNRFLVNVGALERRLEEMSKGESR